MDFAQKIDIGGRQTIRDLAHHHLYLSFHHSTIGKKKIYGTELTDMKLYDLWLIHCLG